MTRNRILIILLMALMTMAVVPAVHAQSVSDIDFDEMLDRLKPGTKGEDPIFGILLYGIFIIGVINMALIPDKQMLASMLNVTVLALALIFKLLVGDKAVYQSALLEPTDFVTFFLAVGLFVIPFIMAGMLRSHKGKSSKAILPAIFQGLIGLAYSALMFFEHIYDSSVQL
jgi:hypothetical protein